MTADAVNQAATAPSGSLSGRVVLITGAGDGLGRGLALHAAGQGATVVIAAPRDNSAITVEKVTERGGVAAWHKCDVTDSDQVAECIETTVERYGGLHAVVHNATSRYSSIPMPIKDITREEWDDHVLVSLRAAYLLAYNSFPHLKAARGRFIVMSSPAGMEGSITLPAYSAVKAGLRAFTKALAVEWGPHNIAVANVGPLSTSPAMTRAFEKNPLLEARLTTHIPMGRIGDPEHDLGPIVSFLVGASAEYLTGQTIVVDGGRFTTL